MPGVDEIDAQISDVNPTTYKWNRVCVIPCPGRLFCHIYRTV